MSLDELRSPYALEELSVAAGRNWFVVEADQPLEASDRATLRQLACVTIAAGASAEETCGAVDVLAPDDADLDALVTRVDQRPLASLALVQLLRSGSSLVAESMAYSMLQAGPEYSVAPQVGRAAASAAPVLVRRDGNTVHVTLNRPEVHNALDTAMRDALVEALRAVGVDVTVTVLVLAGAGPSFCSGGDLAEFGARPDPATAHAVRLARSPAWWMNDVASRTRAELHGACIGAGIELAAFAADVTATTDAFFQLPEVAMGLVPGAGGTVSLPRRIGRHRTALLALTGRRIDADMALDWGLIDAIRPT